MRKKYRHKAFTLLEILLTITLIGILASITLIAINPNRQLGQSRDLNRQKDITDIQQALELYATRNSGEYPTGIEVGVYKEICGETINTSCVNLSVLVPNYINSIPKDPNGNNYMIGINPDNNSISVWADNAEQREVAINKFTILLAGDKDSSFNTNIGFDNAVFDNVIQSDGKILVGGSFTTYQGVSTNRIIRLNSDGTRDDSFNIGTGFNNTVRSIVPLNDGKILVGGSFTSYNGVVVNRMVRLNSDGIIDNTFNISTGFNGSVLDFEVQSDGKILVGGGFTTYQGVTSNRIIRLNNDGTRDLSFDIEAGFSSVSSSSVGELSIQNDGKILATGSFTTYQGVSANRIIRLNSNGSRDVSFNANAGFNDAVYTHAVQPDGKILVGGDFTNYQGMAANKIIRLNNNGDIDNSFNIGTGFDFPAWSLALQSDGKILVGGDFYTYQGVSSNSIIRLDINGNRDISFDIGTGFGTISTRPIVYSLALQADGKIIAGGGFTIYKGEVANRIVRLKN